MGKEIIVEGKRNDSYKLILKVELDEDDELLLKKGLHLLALNKNLSSKQIEILEKVFGYYWYKSCNININKRYE